MDHRTESRQSTEEKSSSSHLHSCGLEVTPETLDRWEEELDQFAADIRRRLSVIAVSADQETTPRQAEQSLELLQSIEDLSS